MNVLKRAFGIAAMFLISGCAGVSIHQEGDSKKDTGIRYYEPAPFLLIYSDSKGGLKTSLIWLPDTTRVMTLKPYAYLAKNESSFKFDKGVLTQSKSATDGTVIPSAVISALKTAATAAIAAANKPTSELASTVPAPFLYRVVVTKDSATLYSADREPNIIHVSLAPSAKQQ